MELITVIVPAYNAEKSIKKCLTSILENTREYYDLELIVVNNGSTDDTESIVRRMVDDDKRIKLICQENRGPAGSRETGLQNSTGDYIAWCDSDDWVEPDWLDSMFLYLKKYNADISVCRPQITGHPNVDDPEKIWVWDHDEVVELFLKQELFTGALWNKLIKRELFSKLHFRLRYWEDMDVLWDVLKRTTKVVRFNQEKYHFVIHEDSYCAKTISPARLNSSFTMWDKICKDCAEFEDSNKFGKLANLKKINWLYGELKLMFRDDYHDEKVERQIQLLLRQEGLSGIRKMSEIKDKLFAILVICNLKLARAIYRKAF